MHANAEPAARKNPNTYEHWAPRRSAFFTQNGLSLALGGMFVVSVAGQFASGLAAHNDELLEHGRRSLTALEYLTNPHFGEAIFENWESEFLQMALFVLMTIKLKQSGSSESKSMDDGDEDTDEDPRKHRRDPNAPWPVRRGGFFLKFYEHSLSLALILLFVGSFVMHGLTGVAKTNEENLVHGKPPEALLEYMTSAQFWFESFQNWQSEFLAVLALVTLSIFLRQRGSPQSKPVAAPHSATGE
jgi:hypothetical protein